MKGSFFLLSFLFLFFLYFFLALRASSVGRMIDDASGTAPAPSCQATTVMTAYWKTLN
jgi:hypothetical protein